MLKVRDVATGDMVLITPSQPIPSGRYSLLKECSLGIHGSWPAGTVLVDDGRGCIDIDGVSFELEASKLDTKELAQREIAFQALEEIKALAELSDTDSLPSPVIPPEIAHRFDHSQLEVELMEALQLGHLHRIAKSPRISMRYDEELLPVSRVKRTANNYQRHLAAHSECWQQRTFTGIVPKKLQAKISEDEVHIYENRVFARLLDHLERYIIGTLARLRVLNDALQRGLELEGSDSLHRSLRYALCETWGESFAQGEAESLKSLSETKLAHFDEQLRKIQQLKQNAVYRAVPRDAEVPLALKGTNILMNDLRYMKVRRLWGLWVKEVASSSKDPVLIFKQRQNQVECYRHYVGLLTLRAHQKMGWRITPLSEAVWSLDHPSGVRGRLAYKAGHWHLLCDNTNLIGQLEFVPMAQAFILEESIPDRILCSPDSETESETVLICSPDNLFTEESVIKTVQRWWIRLIVTDYGMDISQLPSVVKEKWPESQPPGKFKAMGSPNDGDFKLWLEGFHLSPSVKASIERSYMAARFVTYCPCCGRQAEESKFYLREERGFKSLCDRCASDWQIRSTGNSWIYEIGFDSADDKKAGRWRQVIQLEVGQML
ncbi:hypothetical protein SAMN02745729_10221 [Marinobacterium iners DSM 11526]|uniref:DUF2357 domain-containing protein n=2 Tax=Marinobacterium iners TaxID=48076 RepID=A0A1H3ZFM3_9GAMM|nr:hypothetical protein SAMN02745729_10221 [Marinobacterium iners DSM 11526]